MVPARFVCEYPARCLELIEAMEPEARKRNYVGSFSLLVAPSLFLIPYERMKKKHPLQEHIREPEIYGAIRKIDKEKFLNAGFWGKYQHISWRYTRIIGQVNWTKEWRDLGGSFPFHPKALNQIGKATVDTIVRVIRNALAHGNIVYVDKDGFEQPGNATSFLCFLSRYEETEEARNQSESYRMVAVTEEEFLSFLKAWAAWINQFQVDTSICEAA